MKKQISFTATMVWEVEDDELNEGETFDKFEEIEDSDYDNVGRPIYHLEDLGWKIARKKVKDCEE